MLFSQVFYSWAPTSRVWKKKIFLEKKKKKVLVNQLADEFIKPKAKLAFALYK